MACLDDNTVYAYVRGGLTSTDRSDVERHLASCAACRGVVALTSQFLFDPEVHTRPRPPEPGGRAPVIRPGTLVSRFEVQDLIGMGGAGVIYRAYDPHLQRPVALKLLRLGNGGQQDETRSALLLGEARSMARLSHPHVVTVYDAGTFEGDVFVAMELIEGPTLARWLKERRRTWREVVATFTAAGEGLAAAHDAGIVHGDFKPENVLVGADGRTRVTDFGLARAEAAGEALLGGTPAYMAPEQLRGEPPSARSDQFAFCLALHQALTGVHPFAAQGDARSLLENQRVARVTSPWPRDLPATLGRALRRGLSAEPAQRFPSMAALTAALARAPRAGWRRVVPVGAAIGLAAVIALTTSRRAAVVAVCGDGVVAGEEECDDGNDADTDACLRTCVRARCGDGRVRVPVEECDDGNTDDGDGCSARCLACGGPASFAWAVNGHCYSRHDLPLPFAAARARCAREGGDLLAYTQEDEVRAVASALLPPDRSPVWVGLGLEATASPAAKPQWRWLNREKGVEREWAPADRDLRRGCARQRSTPGTARAPVSLEPQLCDAPAPFVCERPAWIVDPVHNGAYLVQRRRLSWDEARRACAERGAHLAVVSNAREDLLLSAYAPPGLWLGARRRDGAGESFHWVTGEPFRENLASRPVASGALDEGTCLALTNDGRWTGRACSEPLGFVCEAR